MTAVLVYITTENREEAERVGTVLVQGRLAACVNIIEGMRSMFHWQGRVDQADETVLIAKTRQDLLEDLTRAVMDAHSYDCPCIVALPIIGGNPEFLQWIHDETRES